MAEPGVDLLVDTSVAVALLVEDHDHHDHVAAHLRGSSLGLVGQAALETYSVLTRLPAPLRRERREVVEMMGRSFRMLWAPSHPMQPIDLLERCAAEGIAGGALYDAVIGAAAAEMGLTLVTRDRRATDAYRAMGASVDAIG